MTATITFTSRSYFLSGLIRYLSSFATGAVTGYLVPTLITFSIGYLIPLPALADASYSYIGLTAALASGLCNLLWTWRIATHPPKNRLNAFRQFFEYALPFAVFFSLLGLLLSLSVFPSFKDHVTNHILIASFLGAGMNSLKNTILVNKRFNLNRQRQE